MFIFLILIEQNWYEKEEPVDCPLSGVFKKVKQLNFVATFPEMLESESFFLCMASIGWIGCPWIGTHGLALISTGHLSNPFLINPFLCDCPPYRCGVCLPLKCSISAVTCILPFCSADYSGVTHFTVRAITGFGDWGEEGGRGVPPCHTILWPWSA